MEYLNLTRAARLLATLTDDPSAMDDVQAIMRAGAAGKIPVYWFNDLHQATYIADFTDSEHRNLRATYSVGPQQMTRTSLRELAISESLAVFDFELTDQDFALLEKIKGKAVDDDGNLLGYRHPDTTDGTVTITREQLFVYAHDLKAYAATLAPDAVLAPKAVVSDQVQPATWHLHEPIRNDGLAEPLYIKLKEYRDAGRKIPTPRQILSDWSASPPPEITAVTKTSLKYIPTGTGSGADDMSGLRKRIANLTNPKYAKKTAV